MPNSDNFQFTDQDLTLSIIQKAVAAIMNEVSSIDDILDDTKKARLFDSVANFLNQAGIALNEVFPAEIADAYTVGHTTGADYLQEAGIQEVAGNLTSQVHTAAVQAIAINGVNDLQAAIRTAAAMFISDTQSILENVQSEIGKGILTGDATKEVTKRVQAHFAANGLTSFITVDNRKLPLDFYSMTVTRTKTRQAHVEGAVNRYKENGVDLVRFPIRSFTCHVCGARERLVVSLTGQTAGYPTPEEIGGLPPFHPNCRHYPIPVLDFETDQYPPRSFTGRDMRTAASKETYGNEQAIRRKANEEKKLYMKMKAEADANGEAFPAIGTWRRMRRRSDQAWKDLQAKYKASVGRLPNTRQLVQNHRTNEEAVAHAQATIRQVREMTRSQQAATREGLRVITDFPTDWRDMPHVRPFKRVRSFANEEEGLAYKEARRAEQAAFNEWQDRAIADYQRKEKFFETREQAEAYIKQNVIRPDGKIDINGIDLEIVSGYCRMFDIVAKDFPAIKNKYLYFDGAKEANDSYIMEASGGIHFGKHNVKDLLYNYIANVESDYCVGNSIYSGFLHEIGHYVETTLKLPDEINMEQFNAGRMDRKLGGFWIRNFMRNSGINQHIAETRRMTRSKDFDVVEQGEQKAKDFLSEYSAKNDAEMWAELFSAAYTTAADDKPIVKTFREWLGTVFKADNEGKNKLIQDVGRNMPDAYDKADAMKGIEIWYD